MPTITSSSQQSNISNLAAGAAGVAAGLTIDGYMQTRKDAAIGKYTGIAAVGGQLLMGNTAIGQANSAMASANSVTAGAAYSQPDAVAMKTGLQQLAQAVQNLTPQGYFGVSTLTQATTIPSIAQPANTNNGGIVLGILAGVIVAKLL